MANPTSNFGWQMPTNTDLVKDLPADFEVFGQAVDTSLMDLKGGTTGQVLSKASNTDMDFTWVTSDDANAIQNTIVDAKGDLISASGNDVPARLAVGNNGETLVADSSATTGLRWQGNYAAGKNCIINGDFRINQRNFSSETASAVYIFDRWRTGTVGGTSTFSAQTFTLGAAPVSGYEGRNFLRIASTGQSAAGDLTQVVQRIESVRTFAGQTVTISFWAKASSGTPSIAVDWLQYFGTGGSPSTAVSTSGQKATLSTSWARYSFTFAISSISGKTIGTDNNDSLWLRIWTSAGSTYNTETNTIGIQTATIDVWGFQMEAGSVATPFTTATGTLAGELAAACRYYWRQIAAAGGDRFGIGHNQSTTVSEFSIPFPVQMRTAPTALETNGTATDYSVRSAGTTTTAGQVPAFGAASTQVGSFTITVSSGLTTGNGSFARAANGNAYLGWSAEL